MPWKSNSFRECLRPASCPLNDDCARFHAGPLCASCVVGAYRDKATYECYPCGTAAASLAGLLGLVAVGSLVVAGIVGATLASNREQPFLLTIK